MAGVNAAQVKNLNHHWVVDGSWPTDGKVLAGRDIADAIGLENRLRHHHRLPCIR